MYPFVYLGRQFKSKHTFYISFSNFKYLLRYVLIGATPLTKYQQVLRLRYVNYLRDFGKRLSV
jgi:hypothetical protein